MTSETPASRIEYKGYTLESVPVPHAAKPRYRILLPDNTPLGEREYELGPAKGVVTRDIPLREARRKRDLNRRNATDKLIARHRERIDAALAAKELKRPRGHEPSRGVVSSLARSFEKLEKIASLAKTCHHPRIVRRSEEADSIHMCIECRSLFTLSVVREGPELDVLGPPR